MTKKLIIFILSIFISLPFKVSAGSSVEARIGNDYYDTLEEALANAKSTDTIKLMTNAVLATTLNIDKIVNIDLNNHNIYADTAVFKVQGGTLNLAGTGTIKENKPNYGAIRVIGSNDSTKTNYSTVNVGKNVTLEGWAGIFITHENTKSHGVIVNLEGKIKAVSDISGSEGMGIYVNGMISDMNTPPIINIKDGAEISSNGMGLYIAGYSTFNIDKAIITGKEAGIGIKSGKLNINGATITCTGENKTPTQGNNDGMNASGTTIQIESNSGYAGQIEIDISNGTFKSKNSHVVYEYIGKGSTTKVKSISISNGTFISEAGKNVFYFSEQFNDTHKRFVSGGEYSSNPENYLKSGYNTIKEDSMYKVTTNTSKSVFRETNNSGKSHSIKQILYLIMIGIFGIMIFVKRNSIKNFINKYI